MTKKAKDLQSKMASKFVQRSQDEEDALYDQKLGELGQTVDKIVRPTLKDGANVYWLLPPVGEMFDAYEFRYVHYSPFHICRRANPVPDRETGNLEEDRDFSKCPRCIGAWNVYKAAGGKEKAPQAHAQAFRRNMPSIKTFMQVVDVTPFFKWEDEGAVLDSKFFKAHWEGFLQVFYGNSDGSDLDLPESVITAARCGIGVLATNQKCGEAVRKAHRKERKRSKSDPLFDPENRLLCIYQSDSGDSFPTANGPKFVKKHDVLFTIPEDVEDWKPGDEFIEFVIENAKDLSQLEPADESLKAKADANLVLDKDEMVQYLEESGHRFGPMEAGVSSDLEDDEGAYTAPSRTSSDDLLEAEEDDEPMTVAQKAQLAKLRKQMQG